MRLCRLLNKTGHRPKHNWNRIRLIAALRRRTYSTITRYCVLRLGGKSAARLSSVGELPPTHFTSVKS